MPITSWCSVTSRPEPGHEGTYSFLHLAPTDLLVARTSKGDEGIGQGRCGKEVGLFGGTPASLARMMLKVAVGAISGRTYSTRKSVPHLSHARQRRTQARCSPVERLPFKPLAIKIKGIDCQHSMV